MNQLIKINERELLMVQLRKHKLLIASTLFILTGVVFLGLESTFFNYIDDENVLRNSLFLPLGFLSFLMGMFLLVVVGFRKIWRAVKK